MNKRIIAGVCLVLLATALVAQDADLTPAQVDKCESEGGCATFTRDAIKNIIRIATETAYRQGVLSCRYAT